MLTLTEKLLFPAIVLLSLALSYRNFRMAFLIVRRGHPDLARAGGVSVAAHGIARTPGHQPGARFCRLGFHLLFSSQFWGRARGFHPPFSFSG